MTKEVKKYALGLEYIGTNLKGWQRQKKGLTTVQDIVEKSLSKFLDQKIATICSVSYTHLTLPTNREV